MELSLEEVTKVAGGRASGGPATFTSYHTDSREVVPGGLFFALSGADTDGHRFIPDATKRGAAGIVVAAGRAWEGAAGAAVIELANPWDALYALAAHALAATGPLCIGITGSNGKTSTRELVAAALTPRFSVVRSERNFNTETGVPLTLLRLRPGEHTAVVLEMGMQGPGEIARLASLARPRIGVVTMIGSVHMEYFASREGLARAKAELVQALPGDGVAVLNAEDEFTPLLTELTPARVVTFGLETGDVRPEAVELAPDASQVTVRGTSCWVPIPGLHQVRNAMAALAVAIEAGVPLEEAGPALAGAVAVEGRMRRLAAPGGYTLLDDAYNASPESMLASFDVAAAQPGRHLAVLGEMRELGSLAEAAHERVGARAAEVFDAVAVLEPGWGRRLAEVARAEVVSDREQAAAWVRRTARTGDVVLVKGAHGLRLDHLVEELMR